MLFLSYSYSQMKEREPLSKIPTLALQQRRRGLVKTLPSLEETMRGSLLERYVTCGNRNCKCARGERHGPAWYLSVTLGVGQTSSSVLAPDQVDRVRQWIDNHQQVKDSLDRISAINRELLRRERLQEKGKKKKTA